MPDIFNASLTEVQNLPEVEVLLATFNGEAYLGEFLDSLSRQEGVKIHLRVSDDGSTDRTLEILQTFKDHFASFRIYNGPCRGPSTNFFSLIQEATLDFVALADQDDVWMNNHLILAVERLSRTPNSPALTFSSVLEFKADKQGEVTWPKRFPGEDIRTILTENLARGCTFVMNKKSVNLIKLHRPAHAIMHDWWILLLIFSSGVVTWSESAEVRYRIHHSNAVGNAPSFKVRSKRFFNNIFADELKLVSQTNELLDKYSWSMSNQKRHELGSFLRDIGSGLFTGRLNLLFWRYRYRTSRLDEVAIRLTFLLQKRRKGTTGTMGIFIYHRLRQFIARSTFFIATSRTRVLTFFRYRLTKKFQQFHVVNRLDSSPKNRIAIVALYPRKGILESVIRLIDSLVSSNYSVIAVINQSHTTESWVATLQAKPIEILIRPNIGRDFGAYKVGYLHAFKQRYLDHADRILFANDSVLYGPESKNFLAKMLNVDVSWLGMFVNYQFHTHSQSFFQIFKREIFGNEKFSEFWENYYPSELRHHAINKGEVGLSSTCLQLGFSPTSFVSAKAILESENFEHFTDDEKFGIWSNHGATYLNKEISTLENTKFLMHRQYLENNITHHQGLLASRVLKCPLKLDIFQTGQVTLNGIESTLNSLGISGREFQEVIEVMTLKGTHASRRGIKRLWGIYGLI